MILWEYQDCGFNRYRYVAVGTTCEGCTALDGQIFLIDEAEPGVNFGTLHPHCDCKTEILDANGNAVYTWPSVVIAVQFFHKLIYFRKIYCGTYLS